MKIILPIIASFTILILILVLQFVGAENKKFTLVFCDVGQGDAIYIRAEKYDILIDGGPAQNGGGGADESVVDCLNRHMPLYDKSIELMIATHADLDHYGGFLDVLDSYTVDNFATSPGDSEVKGYVELMNKLSGLGVSIRRITQGDKINVGEETTLDVLWPPEEFYDIDSDRNNTSVVLLVGYKDFSTVLTGDLDKEYLNILLHDLNHINVFKLSHHGSRTGTNEETFENFRPDVSIISAGENNRYGHPHKEVMEILNRENLNFKSTTEGNIEIVSNGKTFTAR